jgi:hypothetical protein
MKDKIIQYIHADYYEALLTDKGIIYERFCQRVHHPEIAVGAYKYDWTPWKEKTLDFP